MTLGLSARSPLPTPVRCPGHQGPDKGLIPTAQGLSSLRSSWELFAGGLALPSSLPSPFLLMEPRFCSGSGCLGGCLCSDQGGPGWDQAPPLLVNAWGYAHPGQAEQLCLSLLEAAEWGMLGNVSIQMGRSAAFSSFVTSCENM